MDYIEFDIKLDPITPFSEILSAKFNEINFEAYVEEEKGLKAYIQKDLLDIKITKAIINDIAKSCKISYTINHIAQKNWNLKWENNFKPVYVNNNCLIRAEFHKEDPDVEYQIVITPKMSFGTGHHETTYMMINMMFDIDLEGKSVLDIGTGTGVLAILASKLGANRIVAIDTDQWAYENANENSRLNLVSNIDFIYGDYTLIKHSFFDVILVNINTNVILNDIEKYLNFMHKDSQIILTGFLCSDTDVILDKAVDIGLKLVSLKNKNKWQIIHLIKK